MKTIAPVLKKIILLLFLITTSFVVYGQNSWTGSNSSNWHNAGNWTGDIPTAAEDVEIPAGSTVIVDGADAEAASVTFGSENNSQTTLQVNASYTLTVSGDIGLESSDGNDVYSEITGGGSIECNNLIIGEGTPDLNGFWDEYTNTTNLELNINNIFINNNLILEGYGETSNFWGTWYRLSNPNLTINSGRVTVNGTVETNNENDNNTSTFTLGNSSPHLILNGNTPFALDGTGTNNLTLNGSGATVEYGGSGTQIVYDTDYSNLSVTGTGVKQVNNNLTIPGTFNSGAQLDVTANITFNGTVNCNGGTMNATSGVVTYNTAATNVVAGLYYNLTKTGGGTSTLCGDVTVANILDLDNGIIRLAEADLTVSNTDAGAITGTFDANNMIETNGAGRLIKQGTDAGLSIVYPVGSAGYYTPMDLTNGIAASYSGTGSISVRAVSGSQGTGLLQKYWEVGTKNITSITDVHPLFTYNPAEADATQPSYLPWYNPGSSWENPSNPTAAGDNPFGSTSTTRLAGKWTAGDRKPVTPDIYYSYQPGDWDNPDTWTFDPGGSTLTPTDIPNENDKVVILDGRTVSLTSDVDTAGLDITIKEGATLDLANYTFNNGIATLKGQGTFKLASVDYPTVTSNLFVLSGGGTTEYYNSSDFTLPAAQNEYNHLRINASGVTATQLSNITLNGDLLVKQGTYQINDNSAARRQLTIHGDVLVDNGASITTGTGNTVSGDITGATTAAPFIDYYDLNSHRVVVYGDFTNNGTVKFTNQSYPEYDAFPTDGMATVYFMGATNNTLHCNGITDFYNLVLDKGIDQTYKLTVYSTDYQNFRLFGRNNLGGENGGANPDLRKALWIRTGTLELDGLTIIPSLTEANTGGSPNGDFYIPANAALNIQGSEVIVLSTADNYREVNLAYGVAATSNNDLGILDAGGTQSFSIYGKFQVDDGFFSTRESGGIITWDVSSGELIINGGIVDVKQYRSAGSSGGLASFSQSGGKFLLRGRFQRTPASFANITDLKDFSTTTLNTTRATGGLQGSLGTFNINEAANVFSMSGGTIQIYDVCGTGDNEAFQVFSDENNNNVTGGTVEIVPTTGTGGGGDATEFKIETTADLYNFTINRESSSATVDVNLYDLTVLNDLTITNGDLVANDYDISIGGDFVVENGTNYTPGNNWTIFNGTGNQNFEINTGSALGLNKVKIDKSSGSALSMNGSQNTLNVADSMMIQTGILSDGGKTIDMNGSLLYNSGVHEGSGKIVMSAASPQVITGDGNGVFENLELNNTDGSTAPVSIEANTTINGTLTFSQDHLLDLSTYSLHFGASASVVNAGSNRFIQTAGNSGDGGVSKAYSSSSTSFTFPVGAVSTSHSAPEYTPATLSFGTNPNTFGNITVVPVGYEHPNTTTKDRSLTYFWRVKSSGFDLGSATVNHAYTYSQNDVVTSGDVSENEYVAAMYDNASYSWTKYAATDVDEGTNTIGGSGTALASLNFINGEFTAGDDTPDDPFGTPEVYYSRQTGNWADGNTWSTTGHNGTAAGTWPGATDIVVIGGQDSVYLATDLTTPNIGAQNAATLKIEQGSALDIGYNPGCNFASVVNHENGNGNFRLTTNYNSGSTFEFPSGDFSDFNQNLGTTELYTTNNTAGTTYWLPNDVTSYGNLIISPIGGSNIIFGNTDVLIYGDLITRGQNSLSWFCPSWRTENYPTSPNTPVAKTITINGNFDLQGGALVWYNMDNTGAQDFVIGGDLILDTDAGIQVSTNGTNNSQSILLNGSLINNSLAPNGGVNEYRGADFTDIPLIFNGGSVEYITNDDPSDNTYTVIESLTVDKGSAQTDSLIVDITGTLTTPTDDWLTLKNGTFHYEHNDDLTITEGSQFNIPGTAALSINSSGNTVYLANDNVNDNDVYLNGKLNIMDGDIYIGQPGAPNNNNDIEYSGGGNSEIDIQGGSLTVNGQVRRNPSTSSGILKYNQSGGAVTINGRNAIADNAKLEILNSGSAFNMSGGTLTIVRGGGNGTFGDLYLRPDNSTVTGGEIIFNPGAAGAQDFIFDANVPIWDLTVNADANVELLVSPLTTKNDLTIASGGVLDANVNFDIPITINGDFDNSGVYEHRNNLTTFNGGTQQILGSSAIDFYNLKVDPLTKLTLNRDANVQNDLNINQGTLACDANSIYVQGNLINNATYTDNNAGVVLNGTIQQLISGTGTFGTLELDNSQGGRLENDITLKKDFILTNGVFNINSKLLSLGENSNIVGSGYSESKMIASDGVYSDVGISKVFTSADNGSTFLYPLGTSDKYTPAEINITNIDNTGSIRLNNINDNHPGVIDPDNVLDYFWEIESTGITNFTGSFELNYMDDDVQVTGTNTEADYIAAHLLLPGTSWSKAAPGATTDNVDEGNDIITFNFSGTNSISGEFTAGIDEALPDEVPEFISTQSGDWSNANNWDQIGGDNYTLSGGPNGFIVTVDSDHTITTDENYVSAYRTTINGRLQVVEPYYGHNLGTVSGSGTLYLESGTFPAGRYTSFFDCANNATLEYGGTGTYSLIADLYTSIPNLHFTGTGTRILPNKDLTICNQLLIDGPTLDNSVNNRKLTIQGTMERYNTGTFNSGSGPNAIVSFAGTEQQNLAGTLGDFTGSNAFNHLEVNNPNGLNINTGGLVEVSGKLHLTEGNIITENNDALTITNTSENAVVPLGGSTNSFVDGPLTKKINQGDSFIYPIGKDDKLGNKLSLNATQTGTVLWTAEYFTPNTTATDMSSPLTYVNADSYWKLTAPAGNKSEINLEWDELSDLTPLMTENELSDMRVSRFNTGSGEWEELSSTATGDNYEGTVSTTNRIEIPADGNSNFTTACINTVKPRAKLDPAGPVCGNDGIPMSFTGTGSIPFDYIIEYTIDGVDQTPITITTGDLPYTLPTPEAGEYQLTSFRYDDGNELGVVDKGTVTAYERPTTADAGEDQNLCGATSATLDGNTPGVGEGVWSIISGTGGTVETPTSPTSTFNGTNGSIYELVWTISNGGCTSTDTVKISFPLEPTQPGDFTISAASVCQGETGIIYEVPDNPAINYNWYYSGSGVTINGTGHSVTLDFNASATSGNLEVTDTNDCGESDPRSLEITVNKTPNPSPIATYGSVCYDNGNTIDTLYAKDGGVAESYNWAPDTVLTSVEDTAFYHPKNNPESVSVIRWIKVTATNKGCSATDSVSIELYHRPETGNQYYVPNDFDNN